MRVAAWLGLLAFATFFGAVTIGFGVVLPGLANSPLVDANLGKALSEPLALRLADLCVGAGVVLVITVSRWVTSRAAMTLALALTGTALADRFALLPYLGRLWSRVDLIAGRPVDNLLEAQRWMQYQQALLVVMAVLLAVLAALAVREHRPAR